MEPVLSHDPRTGEPRKEVGVEADAAAVDAAVRAAHSTLEALADRPRRAALLRAAAETVEARAERLIAAADAETALGVPRLTGELARVAYQFRFFAGIVEDGSYLGVVRDAADPSAVPPRPELARWKVPLGAVAVFAASNFPFAFSVPGGDTASALAAGCPVVVKAHPDHPETSELAAAAIRDAAASLALPADVLTLVHGRQAGVDLVQHPLISAVGFTGSIPGGRFLFDLAVSRPVPIPFYGELGSLNPVLVTERAATERAEEIATGLVGSYTLGLGQFCTKPGLVLVPATADGDKLVQAAADAASAVAPGTLLDARMREHFLSGFAARAAQSGVRTLVPAAAAPTEDAPQAVRPGLLEVDAADFDGELPEECFGPVSVLIRYRDTGDVEAVLARLGGNLTATLHAEPDEPEAAAWLSRLARFAGRVLFGGWSTGVAVAPAMTHGGPYPSATSATTSVGGSAIDRWLRPVTFQTVPPHLLPAELR
ncbi:aldehyde dehydrogenase (NADP(+)) [Streptacidiphilus monticola]|uniref:Aldehyde dehydrogenase (NADP(+)) n=1 Tax=Streptacidiphilus monticola TaxID=2161674 RepID=A0ABW1FXY5_9ACTN